MQDPQMIQLLIALAVVLAVFALVWLFLRRRRTTRLQDRFGDEYGRTVDTAGGRSGAERNLEERTRRVADFDIRPLTTTERDRFAGEWRDVKALFVDSPQEAVLRGDRLLGNMMETRGYPTADFDRRYEDLTVDHGTVARHYRDGHDIAEKRDQATTEEMRRALNHYERLFEELVQDAGSGSDETSGVSGNTVTTASLSETDRDYGAITDDGTIEAAPAERRTRPD